MPESRLEACERRRRRAYKREVEDAQALIQDARDIVRGLRKFAPILAPVRPWIQQLDALVASMEEEIRGEPVVPADDAVVKLPAVVDAAV